MIFERIEDDQLAHYSYLVGDAEQGRCAVVDPRRDVDAYLEAAERHGATITDVLETHIHADYRSGARELAGRTDASLWVSGHDERERFEVSFPHVDLMDGQEVRLGSVRLVALHTPGHTPEHLSFLVYDEVRSDDVPQILLSGDFLFVGGIGRPDLLGEDVKVELARMLYESVRERLAGLPDALEVHPAHGAGSMCGSGMSSRPMSTLGQERTANPYLESSLDRDAFVEKVLSEVPPRPPYYSRMKEVNSAGPRLLSELPGTDPIPAERVPGLIEEGHVVVDLRDQLAFGGAHIPGAFGIGVGGNLSQWAAWLVPYDRPIVLVADDDSVVEGAVRRLIRVGLDRIAGFLEGGMQAWVGAGLPVATLEQIATEELEERLRDGAPLRVLDVRTDAEWEAGHIAGARHLFAGEIPQRPVEVPDGPLAVICGSGHRSTAVASFLQRAGRDNLYNVPGGMDAWKALRLPVAR